MAEEMVAHYEEQIAGVSTKRRASYLHVTDHALLDEWCKTIYAMFQSHPYLVGSCLERRDYRDVDVRLILDDATFAAWFPEDHDDNRPTPRLKGCNVAFSIWAQKVTGLPVDFQFQQQTAANAQYSQASGHRRNALGLTITKRSAGMIFVDRIEYLAETDPKFRAWLQEGIDELNDGKYETFVLGDDGQLHLEPKEPAKEQSDGK